MLLSNTHTDMLTYYYVRGPDLHFISYIYWKDDYSFAIWDIIPQSEYGKIIGRLKTSSIPTL